MKSKLYLVSAAAAVFGVFTCVGAMQQTEGQTKDNAGQEKKVGKDVCLACHGPYDDIAAKTAGWKAPSGETVTPHQYVSHEEKTDIPECTECHIPHPMPPESKEQVVKPTNIDYCYDNCHHIKNLQKCSTCH